MDLLETFSLVMELVIVSAVLSLFLTHHWSIQQLDVKNTFPNGVLSKEGCMEQPRSFRDSSHLTRVCRLHEAINGSMSLVSTIQ